MLYVIEKDKETNRWFLRIYLDETRSVLCATVYPGSGEIDEVNRIYHELNGTSQRLKVA